MTGRGPGDALTGDGPRDSAPAAAPKPDLAQLRAATRAKPKSVAAWLALGRALDGQGDLVGAYEAYKKASALAPGKRRPRLLLASALLRGGSATEAQATVKPLIKAGPGDAEATLLLRLAQRRSGDAEATATLRRYLRLAPDGTAATIVRDLLKDTR